MSTQIEDVRHTAELNGWAEFASTDNSRTYVFAKDGRNLTVWYGPKGNISGAQTVRRWESGRHYWVDIRLPQLAKKVHAELIAEPAP